MSGLTDREIKEVLPPEMPSWTDRIIHADDIGMKVVRHWMVQAYEHFRSTVTDSDYPCFFGTQAERRGEMFYIFVEVEDKNALALSLATFVRKIADPQFERYNAAAFFSANDSPSRHQDLSKRFWLELQKLHDFDKLHSPGPSRLLPDHPEWEFCYRGCEMFVVAGSPTYQKRRSRNLGPGMVLLFQPRTVFLDALTNEQISTYSRNQIRARISRWDQISAHPDLGTYGDPSNREWKQYCLPDDNLPEHGRCPFQTQG